MKVLFLLALAGLSNAQQSTPAPTWECIGGEFAADGFTTGQNIELNYQGTQMQLDTNGDTQIQVGFLVPKVYSEQYMASAFSITFNRDHPQGSPGVDPTYAQVTANDAACFANRQANDTACSLGENPTVWRNDGPTAGESPCVDYMYMTISWTEAITNEAFGNVAMTEDGSSTRVYMTATVETWRKFDQTTSPAGTAGTAYMGQMTGSQQLNSGKSATSGQGTFWGDGGDLDVDFGPLMMNDWRYTLYQIPFYMKFPKTVVVETAFTIGSPITVLQGVVQQDVISINLNPTQVQQPGYTGPQFAVLDVSITTEVQWPYAIRTPTDDTAPMLAYIGGNYNGGGTHAASVEFVRWDDPGMCGANVPGQICQQSFTMRITPTTNAPCTVAGEYFVEFWAECLVANNCGIGNNVMAVGSIATQRQSQGYFDLKFTVAHQQFCPEVVDTVHVAVDLQAYHDEGFSQPISNSYNGISTDYTGGNADVVYTNDIIFYEATYRTASEKSNQAALVNNAVKNGVTAVGDDKIIDYVRAVKIYTDVYMGISDSAGTATGTWDSTNWKNNLSWQLGGSRVPGPGEDFDDAAVTVGGSRVVTVPSSQPANSATWTMIQCEVSYIDPAVPIGSGVKPADCFTAITQIATDYMDFSKITSSLAGSVNTIDENEVAFSMRMDERVIPISPETDNSYVTVTLESEVYYIGNEQPTRRLLQIGSTAPMRRQTHSKSTIHSVFYKPATLTTCQLDESLQTTTLSLTFDYGTNQAPDLAGINNWALNLKALMENHMSVQDVFTVTNVEKCDAAGCNLLLDNGSTRRRAQGDNLIHAQIDVASTAFSSAGAMVNTLQVEIATRGFTVTNAQITSIDTHDCNVQAPVNSHLASSSAAMSMLISAFVALYAAAL